MTRAMKGNFFDRADYAFNQANSMHVDFNYSRSWFQTPNAFDNVNVQNVISGGSSANPVFGSLIIMAKGTNEWVCTPGNENKIGAPPMCMNPMGMQWMMDAMQGKPKPTNTAPGMIYMLCGATQRSNTDPADRTSPAIPIGPHWMITWPFNAPANGLPNYSSRQVPG